MFASDEPNVRLLLPAGGAFTRQTSGSEPAPDDAARVESSAVASLTHTESILAEIWSRLLHVSVNLIHSQSDFYDVGGHSLLLVKLSNAIKDHPELGCPDLSVADIISFSEIRDLATLLDHRRTASTMIE